MNSVTYTHCFQQLFSCWTWVSQLPTCNGQCTNCAPSSTNAYTQQLHHTCQNCVYQSPPALDVISCVQQHMAICSCQGRQRQHTDLAGWPSPDLVSGISYLRLCVYHRHLDRFKASWRQYFFAQPTRHDSARSWLLRLLELRLTNFPTYLLTYLLTVYRIVVTECCQELNFVVTIINVHR